MKKLEAQFQTQFNHFLRSVFLPEHAGGFAFELKHARGKGSLPFADVQEHQLNALQAAESSQGFVYKISDESRTYKPFDCFALRLCRSYVVIRYPSFFVMIRVEGFIQAKNTSRRKSLTEAMAKNIATRVMEI